MNEIAARLNLLKVRKEVWRHGTIRWIITNEKYIGDTLMQKSYSTDTLPFRSMINRGEKEQYYVRETHEPIITKEIFEIAQKILSQKDTPTGMPKEYSPFRKKIVCANCGCTFKRKLRKDCARWVCRNHDNSATNCGIRQIKEDEFKEIKWRCINRIQYGKKKCHNSPTLDEQALHRAIVSAINEFCEVKDDVAKALRESITEELDPNLNGSVQAAQQRIDELAHNIDELIKLATVPETAATAMADI